MFASIFPMKRRDESFARGLNFYKLFWIFFIGSFFGVFVETVWCIITLHRIESRSGLIYGPFNLVYGFGAVAITLALYWLRKKSSVYIFIGGFAIGGFYEYMCSWIQQSIFGTVSWEYSQLVLNIQGRTNLFYCVFWGLLALIWINFLYPRLSNIIERIPNRRGILITWLLIILIICDSIISALAVCRGTQRHSGIPPTTSVDFFLDKHYPDSTLKKVYPNMIYVAQPASK